MTVKLFQLKLVLGVLLDFKPTPEYHLDEIVAIINDDHKLYEVDLTL